MSTKSTYKPATHPRPLLCLDFEQGRVRRYHRVLYAGVGERYVKIYDYNVEGWHRDMVWDLRSLEAFRAEGI